MSINKYLAGLLTLATSLLSAFVLIPEAAWADPATVWQFAALVVSSIAAIFLPLSKGAWAGLLKTGSAAILAGIGALVPLLGFGDFGPLQWALLGVAVLNAVAIELGVNVRIDTAKDAIVDPAASTEASKEVDPTASVIATKQIVKAHAA